MRICSFLWVYYGYPTSTYEGVNVECMRNRCGDLLAQHDERSDIHIDSVAGVPDSGTAHAVGYSNRSKIPFSRPSSNIRRHGRALSCRPARNSAT